MNEVGIFSSMCFFFLCVYVVAQPFSSSTPTLIFPSSIPNAKDFLFFHNFKLAPAFKGESRRSSQGDQPTPLQAFHHDAKMDLLQCLFHPSFFSLVDCLLSHSSQGFFVAGFSGIPASRGRFTCHRSRKQEGPSVVLCSCHPGDLFKSESILIEGPMSGMSSVD